MDYNKALDYVYSRRKFAKSNSLERIEALLDALGNPQKKFKTVHVVGTNGKGSVSTFVYYALKQVGVKTGLFTSPFVTEFCERIQADGKYISHSDFAKITTLIKEKSDKLEQKGITPTFFETVFAAAALYFANIGCEYAVIEAGIGGRDDSTNILPAPEVCVFTSISLDHTDVLGSTVKEIAKAKSGVIKKGSAVVSFPKENAGLDFIPQNEDACGVIESVCKEKKCELIFPDMEKLRIISCDIHCSKFEYLGKSYLINFCADHQIANAVCAVSVLNALKKRGVPISDEDIAAGLSKAFIPARMETVSENPLIILDGGHNEGCMKALGKMCDKFLKDKKITALLGFMKDKDYKTAIKIIEPHCENIVFTLCDSHRGESPEVLSKCAEECLGIYCESDIKKAFQKAKKMAGDGVLICAGSFYHVSQIRKNLIG